MLLVSILQGLPYLDNAKDPKFLSDGIDIVNNKADFRKKNFVDK